MEQSNTAVQVVEALHTSVNTDDVLDKVVTAEFVLDEFRCDVCRKEITKSLKLLCAECGVKLCLECFTAGKEQATHKKTHDYYVLDRLTVPIYDPHWTALEELMLIRGIEKFGIDNWIEIAEYIGSKQADECEVHYYAFYYVSQEQKVPRADAAVAERCGSGFKLLEEKVVEAEEAVKKSAEKVKLKQEMDLAAAPEAQTKVAEVDGNGGDVIGYMPLRGDFNIEYDNDAELILADMEFAEDEKDADTDLKYKVLKTYNAKLDERIRRKKFIIENNLTDPKSILRQEMMLSKDEREVYALLRPFKRFCIGNEYKELAEGLLNEIYLKQRIECLKKFKEMGLDTVEKIENYLKTKEPSIPAKRPLEPSKPLDAKLPEPATDKRPAETSAVNDPVRLVRSSEGYAELDEKEKEFCEKNLLFPKTYLQCKTALQQKAGRSRKAMRRVTALEFVDKSLNKNKALLIFDFLSANDMLKPAE